MDDNPSSVATFYGYFRSSAAYRCRIAFNLKGFSPEFVPVHLRRGGGEQKLPGFGALNPQHLVPALVGDGSVLTQSLAIIEWLEETNPEPPLLPAAALERAQVRAFSYAIAMEIHPLANLRVLTYLKSEMGRGQDEVDAWCRNWIREGLVACEQLLRQHGNGRSFCFGSTPTLADICLVPQLYSARRFETDLSELDHLLAVEAECLSHPAFLAAAPDKQSDYDL
jgi:maleylacetoacetate isomerase